MYPIDLPPLSPENGLKMHKRNSTQRMAKFRKNAIAASEDVIKKMEEKQKIPKKEKRGSEVLDLLKNT